MSRTAPVPVRRLTAPVDAGGTPTATYTLTGPDGRPRASATPGTLAGHRGGKRYGRLDCPAALRAIARGGYVGNRVFFADAATAVAAGYRPCAACLPVEYAAWCEGRRETARRLAVGKSPERGAPPPGRTGVPKVRDGPAPQG